MGQKKSKQKADNKEEATGGESVAKENNETKPETTNQAGEIEEGKEKKEEQAGETTKETSTDEKPSEVASTEQKTEEKEHTSDESQKETETQEQEDGDQKCIQEPTKPVQSVTPENIDEEMKQTEDKSGGDNNAQVPSPEAASSEDIASPVTNSQEKVAESIKSSEIQSAEGTNDGTLVEESETKLTEGQSSPASETVYPATFIWDGEGKEVGVSGSFNNWGDPWSLSESDGKFSLTKSLAAGQYHYKFYVDGNQTVNSNQPIVQLDHHGEVNVMTVESTRSDE
ncbi:uncharacterized protein LOC143228723 isoform X2 [Tachypleus tridentatus]|uniref:uncharacterized protein LOC143228723 isoform X2 n=1 Tax=Tachypleus tridentatus TaxID=6853 RepID=UPI003FD345A8